MAARSAAAAQAAARARRTSVEDLEGEDGESAIALRGATSPKAAQPPRKDNLWMQKEVREKYETNFVQISVAALIGLNFFVSAINAQILPEEGSSTEAVFYAFEVFFGVVFTIELAWNMYGSWWCLFWQSGWNWFDFIIVMISLLSLALSSLPGISVLRLFRAFRVFRLFKRIPSLNLIIVGILASLPGVFNAFLVLLILMGIWSIMGVEFFKEFEPMYFGNFMKAMFTMWQVMTMDSWASNIARSVIFREDCAMCNYAAIFFISYIFIAGIIMTNVVVAILLEKYLEATSNSKSDEAAEEAEQKRLDEIAEEASAESGTPKKGNGKQAHDPVNSQEGSDLVMDINSGVGNSQSGALVSQPQQQQQQQQQQAAVSVGGPQIQDAAFQDSHSQHLHHRSGGDRLHELDRNQLLQLATTLTDPAVWNSVVTKQVHQLTGGGGGAAAGAGAGGAAKQT